MARRAAMATSAAVGGAFWVIKAVAVLAGAAQPRSVFELAPLGFAVATLLLAFELRPGDRRAPVAVGVLAVVASAVAGGWDLLTGQVLGPALLTGVVGMLVALGLAGHRLRRADPEDRAARTALVLAVATVPIVVAGGALAVIDERLLEVPILLLGLAWLAFAGVLWTRGARPPAAETAASVRAT